MNAQLKAKWIEALRSGKFKQGEGALLDRAGRYCCLGVLAEIQGCDIASRWKSMEERETSDIEVFNAGLSLEAREALAQRNDGSNDFRRHNFTEIADYIEQNL